MSIYLSPKKYPDLANFPPEEKSAIIKHVFNSYPMSSWQVGLLAGFNTFLITLFFRIFSSLRNNEVEGSLLLFGALMLFSTLASVLVLYLIAINTIFKRLVQDHISGLKNEE